MKKISYLSLFFLLLGLYPLKGSALELAETPKDTITIQIGKTKKIVIWVDDKEDLAGLKIYDFNKMISELSKTVDSLENTNHILIISDESGEQFRIEIEKEESSEEPEEEMVEEEAPEEENPEEEPDESDTEWYEHDEEEEEDDEEDRDLGIHFNGKDKEHSDRRGTHHHLEFDLGMNNYLTQEHEFPSNDDQYAVRPWGSWFVGINSNFRTHVAGPLALQWGAGISWYNFKFEDDRTRIVKTDDELLFVQENNLDVKAEKSKLTASYLNVNLVPMLDFRYKTRVETNAEGKRERVKYYKKEAFRIGLGAYAGYRIGSHTKFKYHDGDDSEIEKEDDRFYLDNFRYGARLQLGFRGVDLFANYDLNSLFNENKAPELHAISFGLIF